MRITGGYDNCPYCSKQILYNALKCQHCGHTLRTAEETMTMFERMKLINERDHRKATVRKVVTYAVIAAMGLAYWSGALSGLNR